MRAAIEASLRENSARTHESASDDDQSDLETFDSDTEAGPAHTSNHSRMQVDSPPPTRDDMAKGEASTAKSDVVEWKRFLGSESGESCLLSKTRTATLHKRNNKEKNKYRGTFRKLPICDTIKAACCGRRLVRPE